MCTAITALWKHVNGAAECAWLAAVVHITRSRQLQRLQQPLAWQRMRSMVSSSSAGCASTAPRRCRSYCRATGLDAGAVLPDGPAEVADVRERIGVRQLALLPVGQHKGALKDLLLEEFKQLKLRVLRNALEHVLLLASSCFAEYTHPATAHGGRHEEAAWALVEKAQRDPDNPRKARWIDEAISLLRDVGLHSIERGLPWLHLASSGLQTKKMRARESADLFMCLPVALLAPAIEGSAKYIHVAMALLEWCMIGDAQRHDADILADQRALMRFLETA
ncbi:hypothetical protein WJX72_005762 [[Myrmecia] bisecta]|uniref:Uncharacterized protein n=1 Tax=[Myrmecia] bisecta TaxID=41462 RepID=A0AAW1PCP0_9CHLO